jgi:hypothetical protein
MTEQLARGATTNFEASPWARGELLLDRDRAAELGQRALGMGVQVSIVGKTIGGPWVVHVWTKSRSLRFAGYKVHDVVEFGLERWAAGADDTGVRWTAGADKLAHAHPARGRAVWTLCKLTAVDERFRHPERTRCQACWRALDRDVRAAAGAA